MAEVPACVWRAEGRPRGSDPSVPKGGVQQSTSGKPVSSQLGSVTNYDSPPAQKNIRCKMQFYLMFGHLLWLTPLIFENSCKQNLIRKVSFCDGWFRRKLAFLPVYPPSWSFVSIGFWVGRGRSNPASFFYPEAFYLPSMLRFFILLQFSF